MSRIGKRPIPLPKGVEASVVDGRVRVKGPKGELTRRLPEDITASVEGGALVVARPSDETKYKALHGLARTLLANMVDGVTKGYHKKLELHGTGYKAEVKGAGLKLVVGLSHQVEFPAPAGIKLSVDNNTLVTVEGIDKELVGQVAAEIRRVRPPEPYKGKGIRYLGEYVRRKAGKTGAK
ncbi:MAG: 50S ribosomal protein L6 [Gemmatimonadales bacterium]